MKIQLKRELQGSILDIGGGGEAVIGRLYGQQVTAIDILHEELDEAPDCCTKILMDARELSFPDHSFDNITAFYSLLFMLREDQEKAIMEAARVLRAEGQMHIWDAAFPSAYPEAFEANLELDLEGSRLQTSYGILKMEGQSESDMIQMAKNAGLTLLQSDSAEGHFHLCFRKDRHA